MKTVYIGVHRNYFKVHRKIIKNQNLSTLRQNKPYFYYYVVLNVFVYTQL